MTISNPASNRVAPKWLAAAFVWLALTGASSVASTAAAQPADASIATLRQQVERRFEILPLQSGVALRPRGRTDVRSVEVTDGAIAVDGQSVTGAELRGRLGADADLVLQISYLDTNGRRTLAGAAATPAAAPPAAPTPPAPSAPAAPAREAATPEPPAPPEPPERPRRKRGERSGNDRVRFGGSIDVKEGETVSGDVVAIGGSIDVDGHVTGDVVAVGGSIDLGPAAVVEGDTVAVGGGLHRADGARVEGEVVEVGIGALDWNKWRRSRGADEFSWRPFSLVSTLVRVAVLGVFVTLVLMFARDYVERVQQRAVAEPIKAGAVGLLVQALFVPLLIVTIVLFVVTIIGIPLLLLIPFGILALMGFALVGFTAVASRVGWWLTTRFGWTGYSHYVTTLIGVVAIASPIILARLIGLGGGPLALMSAGLLGLGFLCEYLAWTIGIGAVALLRFDKPAPSAPTAMAPVPA